MVKFSVLLTLFGISSLLVAGKANDCDDIKNYFENDEIITIDSCFDNDNGQVTGVSFKGDTVTQEAVNMVASYSTLKKLFFTRIQSFPENFSLESIPLNEVEFNDLNAYKNRAFNHHDTPSVIQTSKSANRVIIRGYIISQNTLNDLSTLKNLKSIEFDRCSFNEGLDFSKLKSNKNLTELSMCGYREEKYLESFPESLCKVTQLKKLDLFNNKITAIPKCISKLKNLEYLDLSSNYITSFSSEFGNLNKLKVLIIERAKLPSIPSVIGKLKKLEILFISIQLSI